MAMPMFATNNLIILLTHLVRFFTFSHSAWKKIKTIISKLFLTKINVLTNMRYLGKMSIASIARYNNKGEGAAVAEAAHDEILIVWIYVFFYVIYLMTSRSISDLMHISVYWNYQRHSLLETQR